MQCVILAGGLGTRMKAISGDLPKALLPIGPQTFIDWQLQWLKRLGVTQAVLAIGHEGNRIEKHLTEATAARPGLYPELVYRYDGKELLGTGGAVRRLEGDLDDDFLVTYGDSFLFIRASELFDTHRKAGLGVTLSIFRNEGRGDVSNVVYGNGKLLRYDKLNRTADMDHIDYGMMALKKRYFMSKVPAGRSDLAPFLTKASEEGEVAPFVAREIFREIGSPSGYQGLCDLLAAYGHDLGRLEALL